MCVGWQVLVGRAAARSCDVCENAELNVGYADSRQAFADGCVEFRLLLTFERYACFSRLSTMPPIVTGQLFQSEMYDPCILFTIKCEYTLMMGMGQVLYAHRHHPARCARHLCDAAAPDGAERVGAAARIDRHRLEHPSHSRGLFHVP